MTPDSLADYRDWPAPHEWRRSAVHPAQLLAGTLGAMMLVLALASALIYCVRLWTGGR